MGDRMRYIPKDMEELIDELLERNKKLVEEQMRTRFFNGKMPKRIIGNKRGNASDVAFFGGVGFLMVFFGLFLSTFIYVTLFSGIQDVPGITDSGTVKDVLLKSQAIYNNLDWVGLAFFVAVIITIIITSWFTAGNPVLIIVYFFVVLFTVFLSMLVSNFWEDITVDAAFSATLAVYPVTNHLMLNLPFYVAIIGFIGMVVTFAKPQGGNQQSVV